MAYLTTHILHDVTEPPTSPSSTVFRTEGSVGDSSLLVTSITHDEADPVATGVEVRRWQTNLTPNVQSRVVNEQEIRLLISQAELKATEFENASTQAERNAVVNQTYGQVLRNLAKVIRRMLNEYN